MDRSLRSALILLLGIALLVAAATSHYILLEARWWIRALAIGGAVLTLLGVIALRAELGALVRRRRGEIAVFTAGVVAVLIALGYFSLRYNARFDLTEAGLHSLSEQTESMLQRLPRPVHITFFHDHLMRESVELYELIAEHSDKITVEFHDPTLNPAAARLMGVKFAGTAVLESGDQKIQVHGSSEPDVANGILRVSQGAKQLVCFLDGHGEADPFSQESHDHLEATAGEGHSHGIGTQYVLHETHGLAKARQGLETINYTVEKISLLQRRDTLSGCAVLVVAGPKTPLLPPEVNEIRSYLGAGGSGFFMLDPFVETGLEPVLAEYGVVLDETIVIDETNHFWADMSAPAVTDYNNHPVTRDLPLTFFPGARSLSPTERVPGTRVMPLVNTSANSFGERTPDRADFDRDEDVAGPVTLMVTSMRQPFTADSAAAVQLGPDGATDAVDNIYVSPAHVTAESRIAVIGDSDFATNSFFHFLGNGNLFLNTISYLAEQENLIGIEPKTHDLPRLSLTNRQVKGIFFLAVFFLPALLAVIGTAMWLRQR